MSEALDKESIDRVGEELRRSDTPSAEAFDAMSVWRNAHLPVLEGVVTVIQEQLHINCSTRVKTPGTIIEKLKRLDRLTLSKIQDIAGARIVRPMTLLEQDALCQRIADLFRQSGKWHDRRARPSHGYRALHVVLNVDGFQVELQLRTDFQDNWAQLVERHAGVYGRQIQYGEPPLNPDAPGVLPTKGEDAVMSRTQVIEALQRLSAAIARVEEQRALVDRCEIVLSEIRMLMEDRSFEGQLSPEVAQLADVVASSMPRCLASEESVRRLLDQFGELEPC